MDEIDRLHQTESELYRLARTSFPQIVALVQEVGELYDQLGAAVRDSKVPPRDDVVVGVRYLAQCQYHLLAGTLTLLRGHIRDSFSHLRQAIEGCGFARRIKRHPELAKGWVQDAEVGGPQRDVIREQFSPKKLFPADDPKLVELKQRWDMASLMGHSSFLALAKASAIEKTEGYVNVSVKYFDLEENSPGIDVLRHLLYLVQTHLFILRVFEDVLPEAIAHLQGDWETRWRSIEARMRPHLERVRPGQ